MAKVIFKNVSKRFGEFTAVENLNLEVADQEFLCLVGPSGCGKTTTLRMLAGLENITEGTIEIGDRVVNEIAPKERDIAMVFQSYALYPHYSIYDNLAFGIRTRKKSGLESFLITLMVSLFYAILLGISYGIGALFNLILPGQGNLVFGGLFLAALIVLGLYSETRKEIRAYLIQLGSRFSQHIRNYVERERDLKEKVNNTAKLLGIEEQLDKKPKQLSGGQRQRVALGRAIIRNPQVFLMDEPLSNLDAKLRVQMRSELQRLTRRLRVTSFYVTHDQIEAMTLADRVAIMNKGVLQQIGSPDEVYKKPINKFVAGFIGSPSMNFIKGIIKSENGKIFFECPSFVYEISEKYSSLKSYIDKDVILGIRPEHIDIGKIEHGTNLFQAKIGVLEPIGSDTFIHIDFPANIVFIVKLEGLTTLKLDQQVDVLFNDSQIHFFDSETEFRIIPSN